MKFAIQIEGPYGDFVIAHLIFIVRMNGFIGFGMRMFPYTFCGFFQKSLCYLHRKISGTGCRNEAIAHNINVINARQLFND